MRLGFAWGLIGLAGVATLAWGWFVGGDSVLARPADLTTTAPAAWYTDLPLDPARATDAYLARIPDVMRERGEKYSDTRMLAFDLRVINLILATMVLCAIQFAPRAREFVERTFSRRSLADTAVALQYFLALYLLTLPAEIYATFLRPHRFGFSDQTFSAWLLDSLANWGIFTTFYIVGVLVIYGFIRRRPAQWVAWAAGIYLVLRATFTLLSPNVIEPLTNTFQPLPDGPQKEQILTLAHANGINEVAVVTGDASRQTRLLNAHVSGIGGAARISVDDTTLRATSDPMLRAVLGHEIGHYVMNHETQSIVTDTLIMSLGFALIALGTRAVVRRMGTRLHVSGIEDIGCLPIFWGLFLFWGFASQPASNVISREFEHQADLYGLNASQAPLGMAEFMIHDSDNTRPRPTTIEYALFYTHPSDAERIATAMQWRSAHAQLPAP